MLIDNVDARLSVKDFILQQGFPCAGARTALNKKQITVRLFSSLTDERENPDILDQIYRFIEQFDIRQHMFSSEDFFFLHVKCQYRFCLLSTV